MADKTGIQWTDMTWNPVRGCRRVSPGCENCYAETTAGRFSGPGMPYEGLVRLSPKGARWTGEIMQVRDHLTDPLRKTKPRYIFVNSMSDLFFESLPNEYIAAVFGVMAAATHHKFQVLTKRPQRMLEFFEWVEKTRNPNRFRHPELIEHAACQTTGADAGRLFAAANECAGRNAWPLPNVHLGVSVENQETADLRVPLLLQAPAAIRWVSYEPAIGPVDFWGPRYANPNGGQTGALTSWEGGLDWIVVGGESGPGARPFHLDWARDVIASGKASGVPVFVKQLGKKPYQNVPFPEGTEYVGEKVVGGVTVPGLCFPGRDGKKGGNMDLWPEELRVREWPEAA